MADRTSRFLPIALGCMTLAFITGFGSGLLSIGKANILYRFAVQWELCVAVLFLAAWTPAILLVSSALAFEVADRGEGFSGAASKALIPALVLAAAVSIFYLLVVPGIRERKTWYEDASALFSSSLMDARDALAKGRIAEAERLLLVCRAIDEKDEGYKELYDRVQAAFILEADAPAEPAPAAGEPEDPAWRTANRFYLESLRARDEGRLFDANYLARRSLSIFPRRPEVRRLVEETWQALQSLGPSAEELADAAFYKRKLEGYAMLQEKDYLSAFRRFTELAADADADQDVRKYLELSREGLESVAFFLDEDRRAFGESDLGELRFESAQPGGRWALEAARCAVSDDGVFFRDLAVKGPGGLELTAPFARLRGDVLLVRAVDREKPDVVWEPAYLAGKPGELGPYAMRVGFDEGNVIEKIRLSGPVADVPLALLATGLGRAESEYGLDVAPLRAEFGLRLAYPFVTIMLILMGAGLGIRFKAIEPPRPLATYLSAPFLVVLGLVPIQAGARAGRFMVSLLAESLPGSFILAWAAFLALCTVASVFFAARVALNAPR